MYVLLPASHPHLAHPYSDLAPAWSLPPQPVSGRLPPKLGHLCDHAVVRAHATQPSMRLHVPSPAGSETGRPSPADPEARATKLLKSNEELITVHKAARK